MEGEGGDGGRGGGGGRIIYKVFAYILSVLYNLKGLVK